MNCDPPTDIFIPLNEVLPDHKATRPRVGGDGDGDGNGMDHTPPVHMVP